MVTFNDQSSISIRRTEFVGGVTRIYARVRKRHIPVINSSHLIDKIVLRITTSRKLPDLQISTIQNMITATRQLQPVANPFD